MPLNSVFLAGVRQLAAEAYPDAADHGVDANPRGDLCVVTALPPKAEAVRMGDSWTVAIATASAFTYVNAWPTTRAELVIYNGETAKSLLIDSAWMVDVTSAAAAQSKSLLAQIGAANVAVPAEDAAQLISSRSGRAYAGLVKKAVANTAFAVANRWEVLGTVSNVQAASIGAAVYVECGGGWLVPPGRSLCLAGLASTAAGTAIIGCTFHAVTLPVLS